MSPDVWADADHDGIKKHSHHETVLGAKYHLPSEAVAVRRIYEPPQPLQSSQASARNPYSDAGLMLFRIKYYHVIPN